MTVVGKPDLEIYGMTHAETQRPLAAWLKIVEDAKWTSLVDVRKTRPDADYVKPYTVFNIKGNKYRLITKINYKIQLASIENFMTHAEYSKGGWK